MDTDLDSVGAVLEAARLVVHDSLLVRRLLLLLLLLPGIQVRGGPHLSTETSPRQMARHGCRRHNARQDEGKDDPCHVHN